MSDKGQLVRGILIVILGGGLLGWFIRLTVRRAEDPVRMIFKWIFTAIVVTVMIVVVAPMVAKGGYEGAFGGVPFAAVCGLALAFTWRHDISSLVANPIGGLFDGGNQPPDPHPAYSAAQARQKRGQYREAINEVQKQLERFPTDVEGHLLLAQIQAQNLQDLPAAELTIQRLCAQPDHAPKNIAFALYSMADWHLQVAEDKEGARQNLERIIELFPGSEMALGAAQRIAHLGNPEDPLTPEQKKFLVVQGPQDLGLRSTLQDLQPVEADPAVAAAAYIKHLAEHPFDGEAREKLAIVYADHYHRLDLASDQLEEMIGQPNQPARSVVRWLNLLADLQVRTGADYETVRNTLQRIIDRDPKLAAAEIARNRMALLKLELKPREAKEAVKMGTYEQDIGLKPRVLP